MYAIIRSGNKEYKVEEGSVFTVEKLEADVGSEVKINEVLLTGDGWRVAKAVFSY